MKTFPDIDISRLLVPATATVFLASTTAGLAGGTEAPSQTPAAENAQGWVQDPNGIAPNDEPLPRGLWVSGDNGRADNGKGNGGESGDQGQTPNGNKGEEGDNADPPNNPNN